MNFFKKLGSKESAPGPDRGGPPDMHAQSEKELRAIEKERDAALAAARQQQENAGLPPVNRRKGGSKLVTMLGFVFIVGVAVALLFAVNGDKEPVKKKTPNETQVANNLPPLVFPAPPPPIAITQTPRTTDAPATANQVPALITARPGAAVSDPRNPAAIESDWLARKMRGSLLVKTQGGSISQTQGPVQPAPISTGIMPADDANPFAIFAGQGGRSGSNNDLAARLESTTTRGVSASLLQNRNFLITKGTSLDCALETALDSTVPGITTCRLTRDVYSDDGKVLLLDRGSQLVGEYQGGLRQGQVRLFVLWTRVKTPNGVVVSLNSPGTDALGRSGLEGWVDNHFLERFGAAILMSFIKDSVTAIVNNTGSRSGGTTNVYGSTAESGEKVVEKILESTVNIPPTIIKNQGDHIQVMVARDLDFSTVYDLQAKR